MRLCGHCYSELRGDAFPCKGEWKTIGLQIIKCSSILCHECYHRAGVCRFHDNIRDWPVAIPEANARANKIETAITAIRQGLAQAGRETWAISNSKVAKTTIDIEPVWQSYLATCAFLPFQQGSFTRFPLSWPQDYYFRCRLDFTHPLEGLDRTILLHVRSFTRIWQYILGGGDFIPISMEEISLLTRSTTQTPLRGNRVAMVVVSATGFARDVADAAENGHLPLCFLLDVRNEHLYYFYARPPDNILALLIERCQDA